jgi:hypothetical protein
MVQSQRFRSPIGEGGVGPEEQRVRRTLPSGQTISIRNDSGARHCAQLAHRGRERAHLGRESDPGAVVRVGVVVAGAQPPHESREAADHRGEPGQHGDGLANR